MRLTNDEITAIAEWRPIRPGFGREDAQTSIRIKAIVDRINLTRDFKCEITQDDGLSNYFTLFSHLSIDLPDFEISRRVDGLFAYLSACGPIGVVGRGSIHVGPCHSAFDPLQIESILMPEQCQNRLEELTVEAIHSIGYELLSIAEVSMPLPLGVKPFEYCFGQEPWDRVFHALFGDTD